MEVAELFGVGFAIRFYLAMYGDYIITVFALLGTIGLGYLMKRNMS